MIAVHVALVKAVSLYHGIVDLMVSVSSFERSRESL